VRKPTSTSTRRVALREPLAPAGWFFFYAVFALRIRRNDAFNTVSVFYF
jgi:hypothetical protein